MSVLAQALIKDIRALPAEDRVPVIRSILISAGGDIEKRVLAKEASLKSKGVDPTDALVLALDDTIREPGGEAIVRVVAVAGSEEAAKRGMLTDKKAAVQKFERAVVKVEHMEDDGLGFIGTIIAIVGAIAGAAVSGIAAAVRAARERRNALKQRLTPLNEEEVQQIVTVVAPKYRTFTAAQTEVLELIAGVRPGRTGYLTDPQASPPVNEYAVVRDAFNVARRQVEAELRAQQQKQALIVGGAIVGTTVIAATGIVAIRRRQSS